MVAAVAHVTLAGFGHEARLDAELPGDLLTDLPVGHQPVGRCVAVVEHPVELDLAGVLEVAFDHLETHELRVRDHLLVDRAVSLKVLDVIGRA